MDDPNRTFEDIPDFGEVPPEFEEKKTTPTWVWIAGGAGILAVCCVGLICAVPLILGDEINTVFTDITTTLEATGGDFSDFEATVESSIPRSTEEGGAESSESTTELNTGDYTYFATFEDQLFWAEGELLDDEGGVEAQGYVTNGVYEYEVFVPEGLYWTTAGESFGDGIYEVEARAVEGTLNNGFGLMYFYNDTTSDFYLFEISSDGYVWIGRCDNSCDQIEYLVDEGWFESSAVLQGLNVTNRLTVEVSSGSMTFFVNGIEVGRATENTLTSGDIGVFVEAIDEGGVVVHFDNFSFQEAP